MITLSLIHNQTGTFENSCESKDRYTGLDETGPASDYTAAHHKVASCATLNPYYEDGVDKELEAATPKICCYTKLKYKLEGEKFTRKGCTSVDVDNNIDDEILFKIRDRILAEVKGVNRVMYDLTSKPPGTIELL